MKQGMPVDLPEKYVEFYKAVEIWQNEMFFRLIGKDSPNITVTEDFLRTLMQPLIKVDQFVIDSDSFRGAFVDFAHLVSKEREVSRAKIDDILLALETADFAELYQLIINQDLHYFDSLAEEKGFPRDLAIFLLDHSLRPFLRQFALPYQELIAKTDISWDTGMCPVCGFQANLSWIRGEDGIRFLFCEHCFTEWQTKYLGCTYCGNTEPGSIRYLVIDGDDSHQIFVCDKCKGYIKTLDERKGAVESDLFMAGVETVYLDLIAAEEGYTKDIENHRNLN